MMRLQSLARCLPLLAAVLGSGALHAQTGTQVRTDKGAVIGRATSDGKITAFKGIPYAAPPTGDLRWKPPVEAVAWSRPLDGGSFGHRCLQTDGYGDMAFHDSGEAEDCLTLNVWVPTHAAAGKLPVMVWIYGGGFVAGGTSESRQNGSELARRGVVVVTVNYRLGMFGFLALPGLTAESPHHASGNYGLMDQAAALRWVRRNIAVFGGDPRNVTLFGESAGSFAVSTLMASPLSKDLFQRAIGESGGAFRSTSLGYQPRAELEPGNAAFLEKAAGTSDVAALRAMSSDDLLRLVASPKVIPGAVGGEAAANRTQPPHFAPDIDGWFLPESVESIYAKGMQAHIPLLAGWNADEGRAQVIYAKPPVTAASFKDKAQQTYGAKAQQFLSVYPAADDAEAIQSAADYAGDQFIAYSTWRWLEAQTKTGDAPVYRYFFALGSPGDTNHGQAMGAFHSDEIDYVFGTLDGRDGAVWRPEDRALSGEIQQYWTAFARTGNPNAPGLPDWPKYGPPMWQVMTLNADSHAAPDARRQRYLFLDTQTPATAP